MYSSPNYTLELSCRISICVEPEQVVQKVRSSKKVGKQVKSK